MQNAFLSLIFNITKVTVSRILGASSTEEGPISLYISLWWVYEISAKYRTDFILESCNSDTADLDIKTFWYPNFHPYISIIFKN